VRMRRNIHPGYDQGAYIWHSGPWIAQSLLGILWGVYAHRVLVSDRSHMREHWCFEVRGWGVEHDSDGCQIGVKNRHAT
jgi:hypothetical protein